MTESWVKCIIKWGGMDYRTRFAEIEVRNGYWSYSVAGFCGCIYQYSHHQSSPTALFKVKLKSRVELQKNSFNFVNVTKLNNTKH